MIKSRHPYVLAAFLIMSFIMDIPEPEIVISKAPHYGSTLRFSGRYEITADLVKTTQEDIKRVRYPLKATWTHKVIKWFIMACFAGILIFAGQYIFPIKPPLNFVLYVFLAVILSLYINPIYTKILARFGLGTQIFIRGTEAQKLTAKVSAKALEFYDITGRSSFSWNKVYAVNQTFTSILFLTRLHGQYLIFIIPLSEFDTPQSAETFIKFCQLQIKAK